MKANNRTVLLICCSEQEAAKIHDRAADELRTVSGYVLNVVIRSVKVDEMLFAKVSRLTSWNARLKMDSLRGDGPRTTMLLRCSIEQSARIRTAAKIRDITISGYVLTSLRVSWRVLEDGLQVPLLSKTEAKPPMKQIR